MNHMLLSREMINDVLDVKSSLSLNNSLCKLHKSQMCGFVKHSYSLLTANKNTVLKDSYSDSVSD